MQGFKGEVYDGNAKERAHHTHQNCSLPTRKKEENEVMLSKVTTNDGDDHSHHHHIVIGDLLLHLEAKMITIPIITQSPPPASPVPETKPPIHRVSPNSTGANGSQTIVPCDLKNSIWTNPSHPRTKTASSSKKLLRMQKAGLALVKELKSKVVIPDHVEQKIVTSNGADDNGERTHL